MKRGNQKKGKYLLGLLVAVVALGIGYAAVSQMMEITGNATVLQSDGVELEFTNASVSGDGLTGTSAAVDGSDATKASCTVVLKNYGDSATCSYTIGVASTDSTLSAKDVSIEVYQANKSTVWSASSSEYFTITKSISSSTIANNGSATANVTVTLKKENTTGSAISETFYAIVSGDTEQS